MVIYLKRNGEGTTRVAREIALDMVLGICQPALFAEHVPGVMHNAVDALSRWYVPGSTRALPFYR